MITGFLIYKGDGFGPVVSIVFSRYFSTIPALLLTILYLFLLASYYVRHLHPRRRDGLHQPFPRLRARVHHPFATILPTIRATLVPIAPDEEESVLPKKPLTRKEIKTRRGYPRGENQGDSLGQILLPSFLTRILKSLL